MLEGVWQPFLTSVGGYLLSPATFFLILFLTIAVISQTGHHGRKLNRSPSSAILDRVRSFSLFRFRSGDFPLHNPVVHADTSTTISNATVPAVSSMETASISPRPSPPTSTRARSNRVEQAEPEDQRYGRSQSEPRQPVAAEEGPGETSMKKSASAAVTDSSNLSLEEAYMFAKRQQPAAAPVAAPRLTNRRKAAVATTAKKAPAVVEEEKEDLNARADDFIKNFRSQLKLQRLNSFLNYKQMLQRGR